MSDSDSFIEEVSEEVRKDQLYQLFRKYGWIPILIVVLAVGGAAYNEWSKSTALAEAQKRGDAIQAALDQADTEQINEALSAIDANGAAAVIALQRAAVLAQDGDKPGALAVLDQLAQSGDADQIYRDLAALKAVILRGDSLDKDTRLQNLESLSTPGAPFRQLALEQRAITLQESGDQEGAVALLLQILDEPQLSAGLRTRSEQMIISLGGVLPDSAELPLDQ